MDERTSISGGVTVLREQAAGETSNLQAEVWQGMTRKSSTYPGMGLIHSHSQPVLDVLHCEILPYALQLLACVLVV